MRRSRREFLWRTAGGMLAAGVARRTSGTGTGTGTSTGGGGRYVDIHTHLGQPWFGLEPLTVDLLLKWMDEHSVAQAAVLPLVSPEAYYYPVTTDFVLRETKAHRDRLIPFCAIDPRTAGTHLPAHQSLVDMLKRYVDAGARGFGEHKPRLPIDEPLSQKLYAACGEVKLPVLFHLDNFANMDQPGLPGLEAMLQKFPGTVFIGHGKGWWASISGGLEQSDLQVSYPEGPVKPGESVVIVEDVVTTGGSSLAAIKKAEAFGLKIRGVLAIIDRLEGGRETLAARGYSLQTLLTIRDFGLEP